MPREVRDLNVLKEYVTAVIERADHHATAVNEIVLALVGGIVWRKDADPIDVHTKEGEMKNVMWVKIGGERYAFSYNHEMGNIEIRKGSIQGEVLHSFSNHTSVYEVKEVFEKL